MFVFNDGIVHVVLGMAFSEDDYRCECSDVKKPILDIQRKVDENFQNLTVDFEAVFLNDGKYKFVVGHWSQIPEAKVSSQVVSLTDFYKDFNTAVLEAELRKVFGNALVDNYFKVWMVKEKVE